MSSPYAKIIGFINALYMVSRDFLSSLYFRYLSLSRLSQEKSLCECVNIDLLRGIDLNIYGSQLLLSTDCSYKGVDCLLTHFTFKIRIRNENYHKTTLETEIE